MSGRAPHGAAAAHGHAATPVKDDLGSLESIKGGYVAEWWFDFGCDPRRVVELYEAAGILRRADVIDGQTCELRPVNPDNPNEPDDKLPEGFVQPGGDGADPHRRRHAPRAEPKPPEPDEDEDYEYDYDDDCCPDM